MDGPLRHITRVTQTLSAVTSQIFRCQGLSHIPGDADNVGLHDLAYWVVVLFAVAGWFVVLFEPEHRRLDALENRHHVLHGQIKAEKRELARLQRSIDALTKSDPTAWERAARGRLGWLEPGETTDLRDVARASIQLNNERRRAAAAAAAAEEAARRQRLQPAQPAPNLQRPQIPVLPTPPSGAPLPSSPAQAPVLANRPVANTAPTDALGPSIGSPPPIPIAPLNIRAAASGNPAAAPSPRPSNSAAQPPRSSAPGNASRR